MIDHIKITQTEIQSDNWYVFKKVTYTYTKKDGSIQYIRLNGIL